MSQKFERLFLKLSWMNFKHKHEHETEGSQKFVHMFVPSNQTLQRQILKALSEAPSMFLLLESLGLKLAPGD